MQKLDDPDIRFAVLEHFSKFKDVALFQEMTTYSGKARADVVAINGHVNAIEIKSDYDTLKRLPNQVNEYNKTFERNYIVASEKYISSVDLIVPDFWGILMAKRNKRHNVVLEFIKHPRKNPELDFCALLGLLDANELKKIALKHVDFFRSDFDKRMIRTTTKYDLLKHMNTYLSQKNKNFLISETRLILKQKKKSQYNN